VNDKSRCVKFKFAFQWCDEQGEPWWIVPGTQEVTEDAESEFAIDVPKGAS